MTTELLSHEAQGPQFWDIARQFRSGEPFTWVEQDGGYWVASSYDLVLRLAQDWETFSSADGTVLHRPSFDSMTRIVPVELDPPRQRAYRRQVSPHLTIKALGGLEIQIRAIADEMIDGFISRGSCDISRDFARRFPGTVFFRLVVGCGDEDFREVEPSARAIAFESDDQERFAQAAANMRAWAARTMESRVVHPGPDDVVRAVMSLNDEAELFPEQELLSGLQILASGGIGTSASIIGVAVRVLCEDPDLQSRVRQDPSLVPALIEECLRLEPSLPFEFRTVRRDVEIAGCEVKEGQKVALFFAAANRDPAVFGRPDEVDIDRPANRHLSFGAGVHRCIGSNLARLQIRVALEQILARLGPFRIPEGAQVEYTGFQARGPVSIPLAFSAPAAQPR